MHPTIFYATNWANPSIPAPKMTFPFTGKQISDMEVWRNFINMYPIPTISPQSMLHSVSEMSPPVSPSTQMQGADGMSNRGSPASVKCISPTRFRDRTSSETGSGADQAPSKPGSPTALPNAKVSLAKEAMAIQGLLAINRKDDKVKLNANVSEELIHHIRRREPAVKGDRKRDKVAAKVRQNAPACKHRKAMAKAHSATPSVIEACATIPKQVAATTSTYCGFCDKQFSHPGNKRRHDLTVHSGFRRFKCTHCDKSFQQQSHLKTHQLTHTGAKDFECKVCNKRFAQKVHLKGHYDSIGCRQAHAALKKFQ